MRLQNFEHEVKLKPILSAVFYRCYLSSKYAVTSICIYQVNNYQFTISELNGLFVAAIN
jgi:hypothetical protein